MKLFKIGFFCFETAEQLFEKLGKFIGINFEIEDLIIYLSI